VSALDASDTGRVLTVIIGENMARRVIPYAERVGARYYRPRRAAEANWKRNNRAWLLRQMRQGALIVDLGPDEKRRATRGPSEYYEMELALIRDQQYPWYIERQAYEQLMHEARGQAR
jgi:hypothetical protein